jgi:hypothetical protein
MNDFFEIISHSSFIHHSSNSAKLYIDYVTKCQHPLPPKKEIAPMQRKISNYRDIAIPETGHGGP